MRTPQLATLERGLAAYAARRFGEAYAQLSAADRERELDRDDLERFAIAAFVTGHTDEGSEAMARGYNAALKRADQPAAMRCAMWSGWGFIETSEYARAEGWFLRAKALVDEGVADCVEKGYLLLAFGLKTADGGRGEIAMADELFDQAIRFGQRFDDRTLITAARQARSMSRVSLGHVADGVALMDEALVA